MLEGRVSGDRGGIGYTLYTCLYMYIIAALEEARAESHAGAAREEPGMIDSLK